jgi:hypothetical protein
MQDQRTFGATRRAVLSSLPELLRSGLLRGLMVCRAFLLASYRQEGVLDPKGPIASAMNTTDPDNVGKTRGFALVSKKSES